MFSFTFSSGFLAFLEKLFWKRPGARVSLTATVHGVPLTWYTLHMADPNAALSLKQSPSFTSFRMHSLTTQLAFMSPFSKHLQLKKSIPFVQQDGCCEHSSSVTQSCPTFCNAMNRSTRPPCPPPTPGVHSDSRPMNQ